ncbi:MAG: hypothetical protein U1C33_07230 [Candidatus Cloacimonadaceae bacterium]|nr:hypothetical protein [Candidatus Cloacimonadaceae bacterium]
MGHEIGYHYEDLTRNDGDIQAALSDFQKHLARFRKLYLVQTVCMHGRSGSPYDNRDIWQHARLEDFGLIAEPYLSLDFNKVLYVSDTTQRWDGSGIALRDNVKTSMDLKFRTTMDIIRNIDRLPDHFMITIHPELWARNLPGWLLVKLYVFAHSNYKKYYRNRKVKKMIERRGAGKK